jgi:8-amino-7-oxononanoate synthase
MRDVFERCRGFYSEAERARELGYPANPRMLEALGLYPYFLPIDQADGPEVVMDGRRLLMLGSNNYLGLTTHPEVKESAAEAAHRFGTGCTGSRFMNGTLHLHLELEERLARFVGKEAALVFATGYQANLGALTALPARGDLLVADKEVHASIVDGIRMARAVKGVEARFFRHGTVAHLERILADARAGSLVVTDGVFSMGGDVAPLPEIAACCRRRGARLMVDDAHAIGVLGGGKGTAAHFGCTDGVDVIMGTFSKSLASVGGFIAGSREVVHWIQHFARPFIFSAALPPPAAAAALKALEIVEREPERVARVNAIASRMRAELRAAGWDIGRSETPVVPLLIRDQFRAVQAWRELMKAGVYTNVALPPAVPASRALLRTSYMATHTDEHLERALSAFGRVRERLRLDRPARVAEELEAVVPG